MFRFSLYYASIWHGPKILTFGSIIFFVAALWLHILLLRFVFKRHETGLKNEFSCRFNNNWHLCPTGVKLTLSGLIDGKNINAGGHKLGLGLELEA